MSEPSFGSGPSFGAGPVAAGAVCPTHPERASIATCSRCGRFLCADCRLQESPPTCAACLSRQRDALGIGTQGMTVGSTLSLAFRLMRATAPVLVAVVGIGAALGIALELFVPELPRSATNLVDRVYELTVGIVLNTAVVAAMMNASEGVTLSPGAALQEGLNAWGRVLKYRFLSGLLILLFTLLLVVPGVLKALSYAFVTILAWKNVPDPLEESTRVTAGRRGPLFLVMFVAFLIFCVVFGVPTVTMAVLAENLPALRIPSAVVGGVSINIAERILDASVVAAYLLLTNELTLNRRAA